jgi:hypothetical protein
MGYVPPPAPFQPNVDRSGMPRDFQTYEWLLYGAGRGQSPDRIAFLYGRGPRPPSRPNPTNMGWG